jgi:hypothetical protein
MRSPFPGMDPFIEAQGLWEDFHNKLVGDMERLLSQTLPPRYTVRLGERSYVEFVGPEIALQGQHLFKPDVGIKAAQTVNGGAGSPTSVLEQSAVDMEGVVEEEFREVFLEIHEIDPHLRLVTGIEILSPANKRHGTVGWYQYERKRKVFLEGHANLVEIDLLRGGRRMGMTGEWPNNPYYLMVLRKDQAPKCKVWPAHYREPLPPLPIPLAAPDPDLTLALQPLLDAIYERSHYDRAIDYQKPMRVKWPEEEATWVEERLRGRGP